MLATVQVSLFFGFTIRGTCPAFSPFTYFLGFKRGHAYVRRSLDFGRRIIALVQMVTGGVRYVPIVVGRGFDRRLQHRNLQEGRRRGLRHLVLWAITRLREAPYGACVFHVSLCLTYTSRFMFFFLCLYREVLFGPVRVLMYPFFNVFLISESSVYLAR